LDIRDWQNALTSSALIDSRAPIGRAAPALPNSISSLIGRSRELAERVVAAVFGVRERGNEALLDILSEARCRAPRPAGS
jgi:hypothetical protein